ncbi:hypothetical protein [Ulvibacter antarcticus]|uniref:Uncharacterized protein n=1 Tax=Ulvibacter antarcticus TaxID=442714 RepID=A0A3L9ZIE6_9FLAO|nr:hypothetical protein [Ulvibacter antarcticus]RMA66492.1 hypothetical protein BXY75_0918 [Ulvibacter antarcticus]
MNKSIGKEIGIGFIIGIIANCIGSYLYVFFFSKYTLETSLEIALEQDVFGNIIALGALLNLAAFFIFLKKKRYYRARGVLMATILAAILILISKFL